MSELDTTEGNQIFEDPREEDENNIDQIPKGERNLRTQAYDMSISDIVGKIKEGDIVLDPDYQRNYIWDDKRASLLVESILLNVPIPVIYVAEDEDGKWDVVDGLQRLNSLKRFYSNEFKLKGLQVLNDLNGHFHDNLNSKAKRILRNGILRVILIFKESHSDIKYEIFMRLNRGAVKLTEQELRNCLYRGRFNDMLHELRKDKLVLEILALKKPDNRMNDAEVLLRHFTIRDGYDPETGKITTYSGNMRSSLNRYMEKERNISEENAKTMKQQFLDDIGKVYEVFGHNSFHRMNSDGTYDGRPNRAVMDAVLMAVVLYPLDAIKQKKLEVIATLKDLTQGDNKFHDAITSYTSSKQNMEYRVHTFRTRMAGVMRG